MRLSSHLTFDGQCEAAFGAYQRIFRAEIKTMLEYGKSPMANQVPSQWQRRIVHATLVIAGQELAGSDAFPDAYEPPRGFSVLFAAPGPAEGKRIFDALAEGGCINVPFERTFWSPGYGFIVDRFGVPWEVNSEAEQP